MNTDFGVVEEPENSRHQEGYILVRDPAEVSRLHLQSRLYSEPTKVILDKVRLDQGMSCCDAGCGAGDLMVELGARVGRDGRVLGIDIDQEIGAEALKWARGRASSQFSFIPDDLARSRAPTAAPFDLVVTRAVLIHMRDPQDLLRRLWDWTAPGGQLLAIDFDYRTLDTASELASVRWVRRLVDQILREHVQREPRVSTTLCSWFNESGIGAPDETHAQAVLWPLAEAAEYLRLTCRGLLPIAVAKNIMSDNEARRVLSEVEQDIQRARNKSHDWISSALIVGAWKRKPRTSSPTLTARGSVRATRYAPEGRG